MPQARREQALGSALRTVSAAFVAAAIASAPVEWCLNQRHPCSVL
ncbi:hypothetical protein [Streptomyces sp. NPDC056670]